MSSNVQFTACQQQRVTDPVHMSVSQEKLRPIDKKLQYQMDKLLRAAAQLQQPGSSGAAATAAANGSTAAADPLSVGPNPDQLLPKVPLPRDGGGAGPAAEGAGEGPADGCDGLYRPPRNVAVSVNASLGSYTEQSINYAV